MKQAGFASAWTIGRISPGWKFNEYEMRGVPVRIELGPRDLEKGRAYWFQDQRGEADCPTGPIVAETVKMLEEIQREMFQNAKRFMEDHSGSVETLDELKAGMEAKRGFYLAGWCGSQPANTR